MARARRDRAGALGSVPRGLDELWGSDVRIGVLDDPGQLMPIQPAIEANAQPAAMPHVRWHEELLRIGIRQELLNAVRRRAPDREAPVAVMVREHHQEGSLATNEKGGRAVAQALAGLGKRKADLADALKDF